MKIHVEMVPVALLNKASVFFDTWWLIHKSSVLITNQGHMNTADQIAILRLDIDQWIRLRKLSVVN